MKSKIATAFAVTGILALLVPTTGRAAGPWPETETYVVAASVGVTVNAGIVNGNEAFGPVDCSTNIGGACFDTTGHEGHSFNLLADDDNSGSVSMFAGFDVDGDGCVACKNGSVLGNDGDVFFQGADSLNGFVPFGLEDKTLYVFVRIATINSGDVGTTGTITLRECGDADGRRCEPDLDPEMGTICTEQGTPAPGGGEDGCIRVMYPYPGLGGGG